MSNSQMRSALFVPATRPERIPKAMAAGADAVIVDFEDAVPETLKAEARQYLAKYASEHPDKSFLVRINDATSCWFSDDLIACEKLAGVCGIVLPKTESAEHVRRAAEIGRPVIPIVESAKGLKYLAEIAEAAQVERLAFGSLDMALDLGLGQQSGAAGVLDYARCQVVIHSRAAGLAPPLDGVYTDVADLDGLLNAAVASHDKGFGGRLCIHPAQIAAVHQAFRPSPEELAWARRVLDEAAATPDAAFKLDGQMVDAPVVERARRMLL